MSTKTITGLGPIWVTRRVSYKKQELLTLCEFVLWCPLRFTNKNMFGSSLPPVVHVLFTLFVFVYAYWCPTHIVFFLYFVFLRLMYPILPVSLDCLCLIASSAFFFIYLRQKETISIFAIINFHTFIVIYQPLSLMEFIFYNLYVMPVLILFTTSPYSAY
jgi:hypothetical protein